MCFRDRWPKLDLRVIQHDLRQLACCQPPSLCLAYFMVHQPVRAWKCLLSLDLERTCQGRLISAPCSFSPFPSLLALRLWIAEALSQINATPRPATVNDNTISGVCVCVQLLSAGKRRGHAAVGLNALGPRLEPLRSEEVAILSRRDICIGGRPSPNNLLRLLFKNSLARQKYLTFLR